MASRRRKWMGATSSGEADGREYRASRFIRRVGRRAHRVLLPKAISGMRFNLRCREALTKLSLWYLARRRQSQGPQGLIYAVPVLPPSHSFDSVIEALDQAIATLKSEPPSPVAWDNPDELWALRDQSPTLILPPLAPRGRSVSNRSLPGEVVMPGSIRERPPQAIPVFIREPQQVRSRLRRKTGRRDLRARAGELPVPTCLQVGRLIVDPVIIAPKPFSRDPPPLRIPLDSNRGQMMPRSLQAGVKPPSGSPGGGGGDGETCKASSAVDVAAGESFKFQLSPLEPGLGDFSCDFASDHLRETSQGCRHPGTSSTTTDIDGLGRIGIGHPPVELRESSHPSAATRSLPPLPLPLPLARERIIRERVFLGRAILDLIVLEHIIIPARIARIRHRILADHHHHHDLPHLPQPPQRALSLSSGQDVSETRPDADADADAEGRSDGATAFPADRLSTAFTPDTEEPAGRTTPPTTIFPPRSEMVSSPPDIDLTARRQQPPSSQQHGDGAEPPSSSSSDRQPTPTPRTAVTVTLEDRRRKGRGIVFFY